MFGEMGPAAWSMIALIATVAFNTGVYFLASLTRRSR